MFEIGNSLREARLRQQVELSEVELATKIRARYLRALEEESFDVLPAQTYVKGFLRTYADYLGLDGQLYVDEFNSRYATGEEEPREPVVARRSAHVRRQHHRFERRGVLLALAGIGALLFVVTAALKFSDTSDEPITNLGSTTRQVAAPPPPPPPERATTQPVRLRLYMYAENGNCWMDIRNWSQNGKPRYTGTVELGQTRFFRAQRLWINFGNPGNLTMTLNGKLISITRPGQYVFTSRGYTRAV